MDNEISRLSENVTNLHDMFKQMNEIVYAQGEIVDRIDYNINKALDNVSTGVVELQEVFIN